MEQQTRRPSWGSLLLRLLLSAALYGVGLLASRWIGSGALLFFFLATVALVMTVVTGIAKLVDSVRRGRSLTGAEMARAEDGPGARQHTEPDGSLVLDGKSVICPDGQRIPLEDLRDVSAPRILIGVDPSLQPGAVRSGDLSGAAVVIKYQHQGIKGPPLIKLVPVASFAEADEVVLRIQHARQSIRAGAGTAKAIVGRCELCGRELRVKASAVRPSMTLTCKCGHLNHVQGPATPIRSTRAETESGEEHPAEPVEYFEVLRPPADGRCSDDRCPCPETLIPRGTGFLYVSSEAVQFRGDARSVAEAMAKKLALERRTEGELGLPGVAFARAPGAVLICEQGAGLRKLDLATASADARHWWNTGLAPLRATPIRS